MDAQTLVSTLDFARARLLGSLDAIEKSGENPADVLVWRPAANRAHIAWQAMHCAATHDRYLNVHIKGLPSPTDPALVSGFAGGSTPADDSKLTLADIRAALKRHYTALRDYIAPLTPEQLDTVIGPPDRRRTIGEAMVLMAWHESHHQGQIHLTWNLYRQANGIV